MKCLSHKLSAICSLLLLTAIAGCKPKVEDSPTKQETLIDSIGIKYHFDTTQYKLHRSGFYISKTSNIFQLNRVTYDDTSGIWTTYYWLDSLMFYGEYPNKKPLRDIIDLDTFTSDSLSNYEKDKNHVYLQEQHQMVYIDTLLITQIQKHL